MELHFIRHTQPEIERNTCYGQADISLSTSFPEEAEEILSTLKRLNIDDSYSKIISSPSQRCQRLAKKILAMQSQQNGHYDHRINQKAHPSIATAIELNPDLMEVNFGDWELKHWSEIPREQSENWTDNFITACPPNGESLLDLQYRVSQAFDKLLNMHGDNEYCKIAIITHAGVMRIIAAKVLNIALEDIFKLKINFAQIIKVNIQQENLSLSFHH